VVDLDRFKEINDTLGHDNGDAFLRHVASSISASIRPGDTLARLGGNEFGLVLEAADSKVTSEVLDRVQRALAVEL
jgi:diguanylate cyclase (GGDEF)-like protein